MSGVRYRSAAGRWIITATVLGSGVAFLDGTVVNIALPTIARDLHSGLTDLQWISDAYLLTLGALIVLGGSLGDRFGRRRIFVFGLASFTAASVICGVAPNTLVLIAARAAQGIGGALLVPGSLAIISACFVPGDRARAVGPVVGDERRDHGRRTVRRRLAGRHGVVARDLLRQRPARGHRHRGGAATCPRDPR